MDVIDTKIATDGPGLQTNNECHKRNGSLLADLS